MSDFQLSTGLWPAQARSVMNVMDEIRNGRDVCLQSPTGSGKTRMAAELLRWAKQDLYGGIFYCNRRILIGQTKERFDDSGLSCGVRAADHDESFDPYENIQIASADTERVRVYGERPSWQRHDCGLVIVDEAHISKGNTMQTILDDHRSNGARVVLLSATPVGLSGMADSLIIGGTIKEFQQCGALVPAIVRSIEQPDMRKVKRNLTGEYVMDGVTKKIYTQSIVGNVIDRWKKHNSNQRKTLLYAPGRPESTWFTEQFMKAGINWAHVDATDCVMDGKRRTLSRSVYDDLIGRYKDGEIKGISSRFKLREGIDIPDVWNVILATPIGSIQSYLQTVGRALRSAPGKNDALILDHGANYLRHGSPNVDRDWHNMWQMTSGVASKLHENQIREKEIPEPICCSNCQGERRFGSKCPHCGHVNPKSQRHVIQANGTMKVVDGPTMRKRHRKKLDDTQDKWNRMFFGWKNKKVKRTFAQLEGFFHHTHGYFPERTLNNQPLESAQWHRIVHHVPNDRLRWEGNINNET